ncbi:MAG: heavy metal translocating P-type ATPase metal-binding domain-containing protein [Myxococcaceae bacterium]
MSQACQHCGSAMPSGLAGEYCCAGCEAVARLLKDEGLERYYGLATGARPPAQVNRGDAHTWLLPLLGSGPSRRLELDVQGISCAACVWLIEELFRRGGGQRITLNPALGTATLLYGEAFDVQAFVAHVEDFGYRFGPPRKEAAKERDPLTWRLGVTAALTVNVMLFSLAFHFGLSPADGEVFKLFTSLSLALASVAVGVGGWPFFSAAAKALRRGVLHLDLPIALGIALAWTVSLAQARFGRGDLAYLDTLTTFITLMLFGRWLQRRLVERNRRLLLEDDGADGLFVRRIEASAIATVRAPLIRAGDALLIAPGDVVPVAATSSDAGEISTEWIDGEPATRGLAAGASIAAGTVNAGRRAFTVVASEPFSDSRLLPLLRSVKSGGPAPHLRFWDRVARRWALLVLTASALGFLIWLPTGAEHAIFVAVGMLVVTCPCALGLAVPLAYELSQQSLRRQGFFPRRLDVLDRLLEVNKVVFDKTGTLTLGTLSPSHPSELISLMPAARDAAFNLAVRSSHPVSACLSRYLEQHGAHFDASARVTEVPGKGMELIAPGGICWRLGSDDWAIGGTGRRTVLALQGTLIADLSVREVVRHDARAELAALEASGRQVWLMSGDKSGRVDELASRLGVPGDRALGGLSPEAKAHAVKSIDQADTLYLGDGVNDAPAFAAAFVAGTPAIDRPVLPSKSDFFLLGSGLSPLRAALEGANRLRKVVRVLLWVSFGYNVLAIAAGLSGSLTPVRAAIAMPLSTLSLLLFTGWSLTRLPLPDGGEGARRAGEVSSQTQPSLQEAHP